MATHYSRHTFTPGCGGGQQIFYKVSHFHLVFYMATRI
jgi:hypothetical protein